MLRIRNTGCGRILRNPAAGGARLSLGAVRPAIPRQCSGHLLALPLPQAARHVCKSRVKEAGLHQTNETDLPQLLNEVSNKAITVMLAMDREGARHMCSDVLPQASAAAAAAAAAEAAGAVAGGGSGGAGGALVFLRVVEGMMHNTVPKQAAQLEGVYLRALNRICTAVEGSDWRLVEEGMSAEAVDQTPRFSTWDDVLKKQKQRQQQQQAGTSGSSRASGSSDTSRDVSLYDVLQLNPDASMQDIKAAYRRLALKIHPDVSDDEDAEAQFLALSHAYDILSDPGSRARYDRHGLDGILGQLHPGAGRRQGSSAYADWEEFKPMKRESRKSKARDAGSSSSSVDGAGSGAAGAERRVPRSGDVVEYPLQEVVKLKLQDGRTHGVGLLVSRNMDRGDHASLPAHVLRLCEVEPLRQREAQSTCWVPDELGCAAYVPLDDLKLLPVTEYDRRFDTWQIEAELSPGCGGPELVEEIML